MPIYDFNQNMYQFRREGYCPNPNPDVKGYVISANSGGDSVEGTDQLDQDHSTVLDKFL